MSSVIRGDDDFDTKDVMLGLAKIWVNFNGTGTPSARKGLNILGVTDLGTGYYRLNFSITTPDSDYTILLGNSYELSLRNIADQASFTNPTTTSVDISTGLYSTGTTFRDSESVNVGIFY